MASGDTLFVLLPHGSIPPTTLNATLDTISGGGSPVVVYPVLDFDGSAQNESADWLDVMPSHYDGGGLTFEIHYAPSGTSTNDVQFEVRAIKTVDSDALGSESLSGATATDITDTPGGTANVMTVTPTGAITHANAGSPAVGDIVLMRVTRDYDHAANTDDMQVVAVLVTET